MGDSPRNETNSPVIRVYGDSGNVIETHEHEGDFKRVVKSLLAADRKPPKSSNSRPGLWRKISCNFHLTQQTAQFYMRMARSNVDIGFRLLRAGAVYLQLFVHRLMGLLLRCTPWTLLIDEPMFRDCRAANLGFRAAALDNLHVSVARLLISIFHPKAGLVHDVG